MSTKDDEEEDDTDEELAAVVVELRGLGGKGEALSSLAALSG
jgi:hypothetical protein